MPSNVRPAQSRRMRANVIGAPRETLVTNVGGVGSPNRFFKRSSLFCMAVRGDNGRLQDKEIAIVSSTFESRGSSICYSRRISRPYNCYVFQLPIPQGL